MEGKEIPELMEATLPIISNWQPFIEWYFQNTLLYTIYIYSAILRNYACALFYGISTKKRLITMSYSLNEPVQLTHPTFTFHQLPVSDN